MLVMQARLDGDLKSRRPTSCDDVTRRDDVEPRHSRRHGGRHGDEDDDDVTRSVSCTRQERARLGLGDRLDQVRLHDAADRRRSVTSCDVTVTSRRRSTSPGLETSRGEQVETCSTATGRGDDTSACTVKSSLGDSEARMKSTSSTSTSCRFTDDHWSTSGISSFLPFTAAMGGRSRMLDTVRVEIRLLFITIIIRPHCSTTYVGAAYCYRPSSVVCQEVCLSVCLSVGLLVGLVTVVSPATTAEPIEMPFGLRTRVGQGAMY